MSVYLAIVLSILFLVFVYAAIKVIRNRRPYQKKDLVRVEEKNLNGNIVHVYHHISGVKNGDELFYYKDGILNKQNHWVANKLEGQSITYFENGDKYIFANYLKGLLHGDYIVYSTNKKIIKTYIYENGNRVGG